MEKDNEIIAAINPTPTREFIVPNKVLMDRAVDNEKSVTEEVRQDVNAIFS